MGIIGNMVFIIPCKGDYGLNRKNYKTPPNGWPAYIKPNKRSAAIPKNGIAALCHSTGLYIFVVETAKYSNIFMRALAFTQVRFFIAHRVDKPSRCGGPRCRSPPVLHFRYSKFTKKENIHMSEIRTPPADQIKDLERVPGTLKPTVIKNPEAYYATVVRNMDKNDYRANDNFYKHVDSVGDEQDIRKKIRDSQSGPIPHDFSMERQLCDASLQNWLMTLENDSLYNALIMLPPDNLKLIYLLYVRGLSQTECALSLGVKQGAVSRKHNRIKLFLQNHMSNVIKKGV